MLSLKIYSCGNYYIFVIDLHLLVRLRQIIGIFTFQRQNIVNFNNLTYNNHIHMNRRAGIFETNRETASFSNEADVSSILQ